MPSYLAVPGIQGDSRAARHQGEIEVDAWGFGCSTTAGQHASGAGAGRPQFTEVSFDSRGGRASPLLLEFCATGRSVPEAVLTQESTSEGGGLVTEVRFSDGRITSYSATGADTALRDEFRLSFTRVTFSVRTQRGDGSLGAPVTTTQSARAQPVPPAPQPPLPTPGSGGVWRPRTPPPNP